MMRLFLAELKKLLMLFKAAPRALAAGLIAPTVILLVFALTFGDFTSLKLAWVDEDGSTYSAQLEESIFSQISPLGDRPYFEAVVAEREEAQALYDAGKVNGIVACSEGFGAALARGENGVIDYSFNNYNTDMAKNLRLYLEEGILDFYRATDSDLQLEVREVINVDAQLPWFDIIAVAVFLLAFLLGAMFNMLYLFYTEKHDDTLYEYRLAPCGIWASLAARVVVALFAGALAAAVNGLLVYALTGLNLAPHLLQLALPGTHLCAFRSGSGAVCGQLQRSRCVYNGDDGGAVVSFRCDGADQICHGHSSRYCAGDPKHLRPQPDARRCLCDGCVRWRHSQRSGWLAHHAGLAGAGGGAGLCALS